MSLPGNHHLLASACDVLDPARQREPVENLLQFALTRACALVDATHGALLVLEPATRALRVAHVCGENARIEDVQEALRHDSALARDILAEGSGRLFRALDGGDPSQRPLFAGSRSRLAAPLRLHGAGAGVLMLESSEPRAFDLATLDLLQTFARMTASALESHAARIEREHLLREVAQRRQLESLGEAVAGIVHEVSNPLTAVLGFATLLEPDLRGARGHAPDALRLIVAETKRASDLLRSILAFARHEATHPERCNVGDVVRQAVLLKRFQLKQRRIRIETTLPEVPAWITGHPQQVLQVILNLISNAEHAIGTTRTDGVVRLIVRQEVDGVHVEMRDNGGGIPPEARAHIFEPFFTTKPASEGSGLGLSVARSIMAAHRGTIELAASSPAGTTFRLRFPGAADVRPALAPPASAPAARPGRLAGQILIVDDEEAVRAALSHYLTLQGARVQCADSGETALRALEQTRFDLVLLDVYMADTDALRFYDVARRRARETLPRIILMSGAFKSPQVEDFVARHGFPFLAKPFTFDELRGRLERALGPAANMGEPATLVAGLSLSVTAGREEVE